MKIMFIVGSLAEKKNGVADYVLNLTNSLEKLGHEIAIVALNAQINSVPINDLKNNSIYLRYKLKSEQLDKYIFGGRLANYKYYDMHQVIGESLSKSNKIINDNI
jgi:UDP-galactopyranose mutase